MYHAIVALGYPLHSLLACSSYGSFWSLTYVELLFTKQLHFLLEVGSVIASLIANRCSRIRAAKLLNPLYFAHAPSLNSAVTGISQMHLQVSTSQTPEMMSWSHLIHLAIVT